MPFVTASDVTGKSSRSRCALSSRQRRRSRGRVRRSCAAGGGGRRRRVLGRRGAVAVTRTASVPLLLSLTLHSKGSVLEHRGSGRWATTLPLRAAVPCDGTSTAVTVSVLRGRAPQPATRRPSAHGATMSELAYQRGPPLPPAGAVLRRYSQRARRSVSRLSSPGERLATVRRTCESFLEAAPRSCPSRAPGQGGLWSGDARRRPTQGARPGDRRALPSRCDRRASAR